VGLVIADEVADGFDHGGVRRAYDGARSVAVHGFGVGAIVGLVTGIPILFTAGAGAILGLVAGSVYGLVRRRSRDVLSTAAQVARPDGDVGAGR
jgi:hypothetical protein